MHHLIGKTFRHYRSGVYEGKFVFEEDGLRWFEVDPQTRVELKSIPFEPSMKESLFDFGALEKNLAEFARTKWEGETVTLEDGTRYNRYLPYTGLVDGEERTAYLWAQRGEPPIMDVVTLDGKIIAFIMPGRISSEMLILEGYERLTPWTKYEDPRLSKAEYGIRP